MGVQQWLVDNGWAIEDIFLDLFNIGAGERWRDALRKANARCEAIVFLASPDSVDSIECQKELELAEAFGKEVVVAILRDLRKDDPRLARYTDRQFVDLTLQPRTKVATVEVEGKPVDIELSVQALGAVKARLLELGIAPDSFAWPTKAHAKALPYLGLAAFAEEDAGIFFGREADILKALAEINHLRRTGSPRLIVINAASGAGKSSFLRAGLWPRLRRNPDFAPLAILRPAQGILSGADGFGRRMAEFFEAHRQLRAPGEISASINGDDFAASTRAFERVLQDAARLVHEALKVSTPEAARPTLILAVDQAEEMFAAENDVESRRFLRLLAAALKKDIEGVDLFVVLTIRADSAQALLAGLGGLELETPRAIFLPPLSPAAYRDVVLKPAEVYSRRVARLTIDPKLADALVQETSGADALPLLSFTLSRLFADYGAVGQLDLEQYDAMGRSSGSITRALDDALRQAGPAGTPQNLRRLMIPGLATWDPDTANHKGAAKRLVAQVDTLLSGEGADLRPLADALVNVRLLTRDEKTIEVAHEALLRQPPIGDWLNEDREFLVWRDRLVRERQSYENNHRGLLTGRELQIAQDWVKQRRPGEISDEAGRFIADSTAAERKRLELEGEQEAQRNRLNRRLRQLAVAIGILLFGALAGVSWSNRDYLERRGLMLAEILWPRVLSAERERTIDAGQKFRECADCPEMVVVPTGRFLMGSATAMSGFEDETPQHEVMFVKRFAIGRFAVTFEEWDACVTLGGCTGSLSDQGWGRGRRPVVNVTWDAANQYVRWLTQRTGKPYRLLSEAEFEYVARAGTQTPYWWGFEIGRNRANCNACGSQWDLNHTAPVGSFPANPFGVHEMHGNTWTWVKDCYHDSYVGAPNDGSAWTKDSDCSLHVVRGGGWYSDPEILRSANRGKSLLRRLDALGLRVARSLEP